MAAAPSVVGHPEHLAGLLLLPLRYVGRTVAGESSVAHHVGPGIEEHAGARETVAAGAAYLLVVALDRSGHVPVNDVADVRLVDSHAEGHGGDHDVHLIPAKGILGSASLLGRQAGVIGGGANALVAQKLRGALGGLARQTVDDPALPAMGPDQSQDRGTNPAAPARSVLPGAARTTPARAHPLHLALAPFAIRRQGQVATKEAAAIRRGIDHGQLLDDVPRHLVGAVAVRART